MHRLHTLNPPFQTFQLNPETHKPWFCEFLDDLLAEVKVMRIDEEDVKFLVWACWIGPLICP